jgi:hypothetical protein
MSIPAALAARTTMFTDASKLIMTSSLDVGPGGADGNTGTCTCNSTKTLETKSQPITPNNAPTKVPAQ